MNYNGETHTPKPTYAHSDPVFPYFEKSQSTSAV